VKLRITVHGVAYEVEVETLDAGEGFPAAPSLPMAPALGAPLGAPPVGAPIAPPAAPPMPLAAAAGPVTGGAGEVVAPVAGTVQEVKVKVGDNVAVAQIVVVIEAMKMATNIASPHAGRVTQVLVAPGDAVREGQALVKLS